MASVSYTLITKIAYAFMLLTLLAATLTGFATSYLSLEVEVESYNQERYDKMTILSNIMALEADRNDISYDYSRQTSIIPMEYFSTQDADPGYEQNGPHCYLEEVPLLDGERFGFFFNVHENQDKHTDGGPRRMPCTDSPNLDSLEDMVSAPALIVREGQDPDNKSDNPHLPVRVTVYSIE